MPTLSQLRTLWFGEGLTGGTQTGGSNVTIDADGSLVIDGVTVEVGTDAEIATAIANSAASTQAASIQRVNHTGVQSIGTITDLQSTLDAKETPAGAQTKANAVSAAILDGATFTGEIIVPDVSFTGLPGSTEPSRYCGRTAAGAPVSGAHLVGDWVLGTGDTLIWLCTVAGTPGTWIRYSIGDVIVAEVEADGSSAQSGITTVVDITGMVLTDVVVTVSGFFVLELDYVFHTVANESAVIMITDAANAARSATLSTSATASASSGMRLVERILTPGTYTRKGRAERSGTVGGVGIGSSFGPYHQRLYFVGR